MRGNSAKHGSLVTDGHRFSDSCILQSLDWTPPYTAERWRGVGVAGGGGGGVEGNRMGRRGAASGRMAGRGVFKQA